MAAHEAALALSFAPDDYLATWKLPSARGGTFEAFGALTVTADEPPRGEIHGDFGDVFERRTPGMVMFPQSVEVPVLTGRLSNGANVILVNARVTHWPIRRAIIDAEVAILTVANLDDSGPTLFKAFDIQIGGLDAIAGVSPIKSTQFPMESAAGTWAAELDPKDFRQEWESAGSTFGLTYYAKMRSLDPYNFSIRFSPVAWCKIDDPISLRKLLTEWIEPLRRLISIATGRPEEITYLAVYPGADDGEERQGQVFGSGIKQEPYESTRDEIEKIGSALKLKADQVSLLDLLRTWQRLASVHHPLLETYGAMLHVTEQHPRSRLLLLLQVIEGTYGHETRASLADRMARHNEVRDEVITLTREALDPEQQKFLKRNLGKRPPGGLEPAINWLAEELPGDLKARLDACPLIAVVKKAPVNARNAPDALRVIRNDLAHGTKGYDALGLHEVVTILELAVRAYALQLLGCPRHVIERLLASSSPG